MMNRQRIVIAAAAAAVLAMPVSAFAHHSFAMFDQTKEMELKDATVVDWQWTSPHAWLYVLVPNGAGEPDKYSVECANPGVLRRDGFEKKSMSPGDKVTVYMAPLKNGEKGGSMNAVVVVDGKMLGKHGADGTGPASQ